MACQTDLNSVVIIQAGGGGVLVTVGAFRQLPPFGIKSAMPANKTECVKALT